MMTRSAGKWELPQPTDIKEDDEWISIPRIARTIPFGYVQDKDDPYILNPVQEELDKLELARKYIKQYSYREVANWLSKFTERSISHIGLMKRVKREQRRKNKARAIRVWAKYAEKAIQAAQKLEEERTSSKA